MMFMIEIVLRLTYIK